MQHYFHYEERWRQKVTRERTIAYIRQLHYSASQSALSIFRCRYAAIFDICVSRQHLR